MGLSEIFYKLLDIYETEIHWSFEETFVKLLYRCMLGYRAINKLELIFNMLKKKDKILENFISANESKVSEINDRCEEFLTQFCLQCSRIQIQISQFADESSYFKYAPFVIDNKDIP